MKIKTLRNKLNKLREYDDCKLYELVNGVHSPRKLSLIQDTTCRMGDTSSIVNFIHVTENFNYKRLEDRFKEVCQDECCADFAAELVSQSKDSDIEWFFNYFYKRDCIPCFKSFVKEIVKLEYCPEYIKDQANSYLKIQSL